MTDLLEEIARAIDASPHNDVKEWARAAMATIDAAGFAIVQKEPTDEIYEAAQPLCGMDGHDFPAIWKAAIAAAPKVTGK